MARGRGSRAFPEHEIVQRAVFSADSVESLRRVYEGSVQVHILINAFFYDLRARV